MPLATDTFKQKAKAIPLPPKDKFIVTAGSTQSHSISTQESSVTKETFPAPTIGLRIVRVAPLFNVLKFSRVLCLVLGLGRGGLLCVTVHIHSPQPLVHVLIVITHGAFIVGLSRFPLKTLGNRKFIRALSNSKRLKITTVPVPGGLVK